MESLIPKAVILTVIILTGVSFAGTYSGGFGTAEDPYQIGTVADWQELMADSNDWDANFIMIADINLQGVPLTPVGNDVIQIYFEGVFDGNGHTIRNAAITGGMYIGLFGWIDSNSQIKNLGVEDVNMAGVRYIAGLAGGSEGTISNCYATGEIGQTWYGVGVNCAGLVGVNGGSGTIIGCHADCDINSGGGNGGLVGRNYGTISDSYAAGTVSVEYQVDDVGGLVGTNCGTILDSHADGNIIGYGHVGGLVGENTDYWNSPPYYVGSITRCYATGSVNGVHSVGGLVGSTTDNDYLFKYITDCYATGSVTGTSAVGGLIGNNYALCRVTNCYASGMVSGSSYVGGLIGYGFSILTVTNCFWDIETSGQTTSAGGTGLTTAQMKTLSIFKSAGWDFVDTWGIGENQTYPFLRTYSGADLNYDGVVDFIDFAVWADHWLESF